MKNHWLIMLFLIFGITFKAISTEIEVSEEIGFYQLKGKINVVQKLFFPKVYNEAEVRFNLDSAEVRELIEVRELSLEFNEKKICLKFGRLIEKGLEQTFSVNPGEVVNPIDYTKILSPEKLGAIGVKVTLSHPQHALNLWVARFLPAKLPNSKTPWYPKSLTGFELPETPAVVNLTLGLRSYVGSLTHWLVLQQGLRPYVSFGGKEAWFEKQNLVASLGNIGLPLKDVMFRWEMVLAIPEKTHSYLAMVMSLDRPWFRGAYELHLALQGSLVWGGKQVDDPLNWHRLFNRHLMGQILVIRNKTELEIKGITKLTRGPGEHYFHFEARERWGDHFIVGTRFTCLGGEPNTFFGGLNSTRAIKITLQYIF